MLSIERKNIILERIKNEKHVVVSELSREFGVSEETIRRDMEKLEKDGYIIRTYGGAVYNDDGKRELPYEIRKKTNVDAKQRIAKKVAEMICDGDCIMLDESSTSTFVVRALRKAGRRNITIVTNSIEIVMEAFGMQGWNILSTGGTLKHNSLAFSGHRAENMVRSYHVNKTIISCSSIDIDSGYTDNKEDNAMMKRAMMSVAKQTVLAADSHKFNRIAFAGIGSLTELDVLVTESDPGEQWRNALYDAGVELKIADEQNTDE